MLFKTFLNLLKNSRKFKFSKNANTFDEFLPRFSVSSGAKMLQSCRSQKMLNNDYLLAMIGADTAENEP